MWRGLLAPLADAGFRAIAPDLLGFGDSPVDPPHTWERQIEALEAFRLAEGLERVTLVVHDWGGLIGLRWACDHPEAVARLVVSDTGFFADGKWHGLAKSLRTPGEGEQIVDGMTREGLGTSSPRRAAASTTRRPTSTSARAPIRNGAEAPSSSTALGTWRSSSPTRAGSPRSRPDPAAVGADDPFAPVAGRIASTRRSPARSSWCSTARALRRRGRAGPLRGGAARLPRADGPGLGQARERTLSLSSGSSTAPSGRPCDQRRPRLAARALEDELGAAARLEPRDHGERPQDDPADRQADGERTRHGRAGVPDGHGVPGDVGPVGGATPMRSGARSARRSFCAHTGEVRRAVPRTRPSELSQRNRTTIR
jgi:haloalkane dehalogenase